MAEGAGEVVAHQHWPTAELLRCANGCTRLHLPAPTPAHALHPPSVLLPQPLLLSQHLAHRVGSASPPGGRPPGRQLQSLQASTHHAGQGPARGVLGGLGRRRGGWPGRGRRGLARRRHQACSWHGMQSMRHEQSRARTLITTRPSADCTSGWCTAMPRLSSSWEGRCRPGISPRNLLTLLGWNPAPPPTPPTTTHLLWTWSG